MVIYIFNHRLHSSYYFATIKICLYRIQHKLMDKQAFSAMILQGVFMFVCLSSRGRESDLTRRECRRC